VSETEKNDKQADTEEADIIEVEVISEASAQGSAPDMKTVPPADTKRKGGNAGWITAALLAAFLGGVYGSPYFEAGLISLGLRSERDPQNTGPTGAPDLGAELAPLKTQIADLKAASVRHQEIMAQQRESADEITRLQQQLRSDVDLLAGQGAATVPSAAMADASAELAGLKADITRLSDDLARLSLLNSEVDPELSALTGALALARAESAQLKARLIAVEDTVQARAAGALEGSPRGRLVLSLSRMKDRALAGLPFGAEVAGLRADISALPALDQQLMGAEIAILVNAGKGIQPYASLVRDFDPTVAAALRAGEKADGSFLSSLFTSRRTDAGATGDDAVFVKAERLLLARDVAGSVEALDALEGAVAKALTPWRRSAETHVATVRAFDRLIRAVAQNETVARAGGAQ